MIIPCDMHAHTYYFALWPSPDGCRRALATPGLYRGDARAWG